MARLGKSITLAVALSAITSDPLLRAASLEEGPSLTAVVGTRLFVRGTEEPRIRRIIVQIDDASVAFTAAEATVTGMWLDVFNPLSGEAQCLALPAMNWTRLGGVGRYVYRDRDRTAGPVEWAFVVAGRVKIIARGPAVTYTVDEPTQGEIDAHIVVGDGSRFCARFGAPTADRPGVFLAHRAPAASCLEAPAPCGPITSLGAAR
jgi:hypothetical protein